jgi:hypothetical protein
MDRKSRYQAIVSAIKRNIRHYKEMLAESSNDYEKRFYRNLLYNETLKLNYWKMYGNNRFNDEEDWERETSVLEQRKFTREELSQYNGSGGRPAYVLHDARRQEARCAYDHLRHARLITNEPLHPA